MKAVILFLASPFIGLAFLVSFILPIDNKFGIWLGATAAQILKRLFHA